MKKERTTMGEKMAMKHFGLSREEMDKGYESGKLTRKKGQIGGMKLEYVQLDLAELQAYSEEIGSTPRSMDPVHQLRHYKKELGKLNIRKSGLENDIANTEELIKYWQEQVDALPEEKKQKQKRRGRPRKKATTTSPPTTETD